jgi:DNA-binding transcriptional LysR family regulator
MRNNPPRSERNVSQWETIDLNRLRVFAQVVEKRSFTAAAVALGLPKSSVSKSVRALEETLGVQLIQRSSRSVRATDAGSTLFESIRPAMAVITESVSATAIRGSDPRGRVRVSCPPDFDELLAPYVARFCHDHPGIAVEISLSARNVDLIADGYDLALRGGDLHDSGYVVRGTLRSAFALFASPTYLRTRKAPRRIPDLAEHVCIGVHPVGGRATWQLGNGTKTERVRVTCQMTTDDMRLASRLAVAGGGIVLLPLITAETLVAAGRLVRVLPKVSMPNVSLRIITPNRSLEPLAVRMFREGLFAELEKRSRSRGRDYRTREPTRSPS